MRTPPVVAVVSATLLLVAACGAPAPPPSADPPTRASSGGEPDAAARAAVLAPLLELFAALESGDASALPVIFDERVVMHSTSVDAEGRTTASSTTLAQMIDRIESSEVPSIERVFDADVRIHGDLAAVWAPYDFYRGGEFSHCGIDGALLERREGRWVMTALSWTRAQPPACDLHPDGPPRS